MAKQGSAMTDARYIDIRVLDTGEGKVLVPMTASDAEELAYATGNKQVRARLIRAIGLLDSERAKRIKDETDDL